MRTLPLAACAALAGCRAKPAPAPVVSTRVDETMRTLGAEGLRLEGATVVVQVAPASVTGSRFYRGLAAALGDGAGAPPHEALRERLGIDLSTVEALVFTFDPGRNAFILAVATREPVEHETWLAAMSRTRGDGASLERFDSHAGADLYAPPGERGGAVAFPAPNVAAAGSTPDLRLGLERVKAGSAAPYRGEIVRLLARAPARADALVAAVPTAKLMEALTAAAGGPSFAKVSEKAEGILIAATARETLEVEARIFMRTAADASAARKEAREALDELARGLGAGAALAGMRPLVDLVRDARVGGAGTIVEIGVAVPPGAMAPLVRLAGGGAD